MEIYLIGTNKSWMLNPMYSETIRASQLTMAILFIDCHLA